MRRVCASTAVILAVFSSVSHSMALGGGIGNFTAHTHGGKNDGAVDWNLSAPTWSFKIVDPEGSLLSAMNTASSNYGARLGAQQRAQDEANRTGGTATANYEVKTSVNSTGSTQTFELIWAHDGEFSVDQFGKRTLCDPPDNLTLQGSLAGDITAWNDLGGLPLSLIPYWKMVVGYIDLTTKKKSGGTAEVSSGWITIPFGVGLVYDAPLNISVKGYGGYDPLTGLVSIWSKGVYQAWEYGAGTEWAPLDWLVAEAGFNASVTNLQHTTLPKLSTTTLNFGARIDFDGF